MTTHLRVFRKDLIDAVARVSRSIDSRASLEVLQNVHLIARYGSLFVAGTNLDTAIFNRIGCNGSFDDTTANAADLLKALKFVKTEVVVLSNAGKSGRNRDDLLVATSDGRIKIRVDGIVADEFPKLDGMWVDDPTGSCRFTYGTLAAIVGQIATATATDDSRPALTCVLFEVLEQGAIRATATDGFALHSGNYPATATGGLPPRFIIPAAHLALALAALKGDCDPDDYVVLQILGFVADHYGAPKLQNIRFQSDRLGAIKVLGRMGEGNFPDYTTILPDTDMKFAHLLELDRLELLAVVDAAIGLTGKKETPGLRFEVDPEFGSVDLYLRERGDVHRADFKIEHFAYVPGHSTGNAPFFSVDARLLRRAITTGGTKIKLAWNSKNEPVYIDHDWVYRRVIMPLNFNA